MSDEIKPCPFCGSTDIDHEDSAHAEWVVCNYCRAEGPPSNSGDHFDKWNGRAESKTESNSIKSLHNERFEWIAKHFPEIVAGYSQLDKLTDLEWCTLQHVILESKEHK